MSDLIYISEFIDHILEQNLINDIKQYKLNNPKNIANYGKMNYNSLYFGDRYKKDNDYPSSIQNVINLLLSQNIVIDIPNGIAINEYSKGQKIGPHIDKKISGPVVTILSLNSECTMIFKRKNYEDIVQILEPRSIIQMSGDIRDLWTHEILPVKETRYSIIFRS